MRVQAGARTNLDRGTRAIPRSTNPRPGVPRAALALALGAGVVLRLREYLFNRSLWTDEAALALNILGRSYAGLLEPLDIDQGAPPAFLFVEKALTDLLGPGELALRLAPLLSGVAALVLVYLGGRRLVGERGAVLATGLLAMLQPAIYYSAEVKQYSTDVAITLLLLWLGARTLEESAGGRRYVALALAGAVAMWFSHAAMMVNAGVGIVLMARAVHIRSATTARWLALPALAWVASFVPLYLVSLSHLVANDYLHDFWVGRYPPLVPTSPADLRWYHTALFSLAEESVGRYGGALALFALLGGAATLLSKEAARWTAALLVAPIVVCWFLSGLELYPFSGRMILFLVPPLLLLIATGVVAVWDRSRLMGACAGVALFVTPVLTAAADFGQPSGREELRPVLERVQQVAVPGDRFIVYYGAQNAFQYYTRHGDLGPLPAPSLIETSRRDWRAYERQLDDLARPGRAWVVFSHVYAAAGADEQALLLFLLDGMGERLGQITADGAGAYLYEFAG